LAECPFSARSGHRTKLLPALVRRFGPISDIGGQLCCDAQLGFHDNDMVGCEVTAMGKDRLAAFSDGVIAIIITIMVLELKVPHGSSWEVLAGVAPNFVSYVLSFVYLAIYWNNHHHLVHTVARVDGLILWANSHLLFWLSLIPAATAWMGENFLASIPTAVYGTSLLMPAIA
jgi:uncharacterized membrane protein